MLRLAVFISGVATVSAQSYQLIDSGQCEDQNLVSLTTAAECQEAANHVDGSYQYQMNFQTSSGCWSHSSGLYFNANQGRDCTVERKCVCAVPPPSAEELDFSHNGNEDFVYNGNNDLEIALCKDKAYTFKRSTSGHPLRVVKESECTGCDSGTHNFPASTVTGWSDVSGDSSKEFTFTEVGTYYYLCTSHANMVGKITVTACSTTPCAENEHVSGGECTACALGKAQAAGDDPSGSDTTCTSNTVCTSTYDFRQCTWASYSGGSTTWSPPDVTDSPYDQTKIYPEGSIGVYYDASIIDSTDRKAFADECARGCAAANHGYSEIYVHFQPVKPQANKYQCFCRSGSSTPSFNCGPSDKRYFAAKIVCSVASTPSTCAENEHVSNLSLIHI